MTSIWYQQWDDLLVRDALRAEVLHRAATIPSHSSHNQGGWRSHDDVLDWPFDAARMLRVRLDEAVAAWRVRVFRAWAIVNRAGSYHRRHIHGESTWSGICYLDGGEDSARTVIEVAPEPVRITPIPGCIVLFPSPTWHSVEPHHGSDPRVTIAFDAR